MVAVQRKPASEEAKLRRRISRQCAKVVSGGPVRSKPTTAHVSESKLTDKQRHLLHKQANRLFQIGALDLRYVGVHFLELYELGWTPINGIMCTPEQFDEVWDWWAGLHWSQRDDIRELSNAEEHQKQADRKLGLQFFSNIWHGK